MALRHHGYHTLEAFDGRTGLAAFLRHRDDVDLVLTDIVMPHPGAGMADEILRHTPSAKIIFMSGTAGVSEFPQHLKRFPLLKKPFTITDLLHAVGNALAAKRDGHSA